MGPTPFGVEREGYSSERSGNWPSSVRGHVGTQLCQAGKSAKSQHSLRLGLTASVFLSTLTTRRQVTKFSHGWCIIGCWRGVIRALKEPCVPNSGAHVFQYTRG